VTHTNSASARSGSTNDPSEPIVEIGYSLHPDHQGNGYATEAVNALVRMLRDHGMEQVVAGCDVDNGRSARLLERLGFSFDGITDGERVCKLAIAGTATFGP